MQNPEEEMTTQEKMKYYATLTFGTTACVSSFIFMFTIPWVLDPSISTLIANFNPEPVVCKSVYFEQRLGMTNCSWSSCKVGCTIDLYSCDMIYVSYMNVAFEDYIGQEPGDENGTEWLAQGVPLLINIKACGYPPRVNCTVFVDKYAELESIFACYYSRVDKNLVITDYSYGEEVSNIIIALFVPNLLCAISVGVVSYWWYPGCQKRRCQYQLPPDQKDLSVNTTNEEDEDDDDDDDDDDDEDKGESCDDGKGSSYDDLSSKKSRSLQEEEEKDLDTTINMPEEKV